MMSNTTIVIPDSHSTHGDDNLRAIWLGKLIVDVKPKEVIHLGDSCDFESLCSYDKGTRNFVGRNYKQDVDAHLDFQDKLWSTVKRAKKKLPKRVFLIGNHEHRIEKALDRSPELEGTISKKDLQLDYFYDRVIDYYGGTPGVYESSGVYYSHYFASGVMGRPIGGEHGAYTLLTKKFLSCTQGHDHRFDFATRTTEAGKRINGLLAGMFKEEESVWAGDVNKLWARGVVIKHNVVDGDYDLEWVSLKRLKKEYEAK